MHVFRLVVAALLCVSCVEGEPAPVCDDDEVWFAGTGHCYSVVAKSPWAEARQLCRDRGAELVGISSADEYDFLVNALPAALLWTGGNDLDDDETFTWDNGEPWTEEFWNTGEPDDPARNCVLIYLHSHLKLADGNCGDSYQGICERSQAVQ